MPSKSKKIREQGQPVLPTVKQEKDPTKQGRTRGRALKETNKRYSRIKKRIMPKILDVIRSTDKKIIQNNIEVNKRVYEYQIDQSLIGNLSQFILNILNDELSTSTYQSYDNHWLSLLAQGAYQSGASDVLQSAKNISTAKNVGQDLSLVVRSVGVDALINNQQYLRRVGLVKGRVLENMQGLTNQTRSDIVDTLSRGMANGDGIGSITKNITERIDVSRSRAQRIARTEINNAYRQASRNETQTVNDELFDDSDYEMRLLWFSALSPTTRKTHKSRHGIVYTPAEVNQFYSRDGNAINCLCSQTQILVNKKTGQIFQSELIAEMKAEREAA